MPTRRMKPWITGISTFRIPLIAHPPMPGHAKTVSTIADAPINDPNRIAEYVKIGVRAATRAYASTFLSGSPHARANSTWAEAIDCVIAVRTVLAKYEEKKI